MSQAYLYRLCAMFKRVNIIHPIVTYSYSVCCHIYSYTWNSIIPLHHVKRYPIMCVVSFPIHYWTLAHSFNHLYTLPPIHHWSIVHLSTPVCDVYSYSILLGIHSPCLPTCLYACLCECLPASMCEVPLMHPCVYHTLYIRSNSTVIPFNISLVLFNSLDFIR